ncbi:MAG: GIY-YIG nuclease family protein, partial [Finegoldia magna]|nr:GIY-YIG nuclease family protein [Finegoldia magna]
MNELNKETIGGCVYIINFGFAIKIGCSSKPRKRIKNITSYLKNYASIEAEDIFVSPRHVNYRENEKLMHKKFEHDRLEGSELFTISYPLAVETLSDLDMDCDLEKERKRIERSSEAFKNGMISLNQQLEISRVYQKVREIFLDEKELSKHIEEIRNTLEVLEVIKEYLHYDLSNEEFEAK